MRTVIFVGLIYIGDSISKGAMPPNYSTGIVGVLAIIFVAAAIMDVVDFFRGKTSGQ
jgi:hypothetical protein